MYLRYDRPEGANVTGDATGRSPVCGAPRRRRAADEAVASCRARSSSAAACGGRHFAVEARQHLASFSVDASEARRAREAHLLEPKWQRAHEGLAWPLSVAVRYRRRAARRRAVPSERIRGRMHGDSARTMYVAV